MEPKYVIWSEEHGAWWASAKLGYTRSLAEAGRFTKLQAESIEKSANLVVHPGGPVNPGRTFNELAIADPL